MAWGSRYARVPIPEQENPVFRIAAYSVAGSRQEQQDSFGFRLLEKNAMAFVCDGMGGQQGGGRASFLAAKMLMERFRLLDTPLESLKHMVGVLKEADRQIADLRDEAGNPLNAGSTVVWILVQNGLLGWCAAGDSRAYLMRQGELVPFTQEQNYRAVLEEQRRSGLISAQQYEAELAQGESLISFLGIGNLFLIDYSSRLFPLEKGDRIILMTDGLYRLLSDREMQEILLRHAAPKKALRAMENAAAKKAAESHILRDNTTAVLLCVL
ncbi:MAG: protein phosphatase 2C domain-containing protein [Lachnospiraceae bacterium]|nr:protein phosphatase 2C domain-containing protein [Lachnospiraceae bacterium]